MSNRTAGNRGIIVVREALIRHVDFVILSSFVLRPSSSGDAPTIHRGNKIFRSFSETAHLRKW
jgi:hypothetical protein